MKRFIFTPLLIGSLALLAACADQFHAPAQDGEQTQTPILYGAPAALGEFPSTVAILRIYESQFGNFGQLQCTGTLIAPDVVMTAGHCVADLFPIPYREFISFEHDLSAWSFLQDPEPPADAIQTVERIMHPDFDLNTQPTPGLGDWHDVGILFLEAPAAGRPISYVADVNDLPFITQGSTVAIAGYGQTSTAAEGAGVKFQGTTIINELADFEMQIGDISPLPQKCHGDSGGPTFIDIHDGRQPVRRNIGITSRAYGDQDCNEGGIDMRADAYRPWFDAEMKAACARGVRVPFVCDQYDGLLFPGDAPFENDVSPDAGVPTPDLGFAVDAGNAADAAPADASVEPAIDAGVEAPDAGGSQSPGASAPEEDGCRSANRASLCLWLVAGFGLWFHRRKRS